MEFLGLSPVELLVIAIVAILVFGARLPQVAGEAAATLQRVRRSLADLRRETGIDQEIARARREFETNVRRPLTIDLPNTIRREAREAQRALDPSAPKAVESPPAPPSATPAEPAPADGADAPRTPTPPPAES